MSNLQNNLIQGKTGLWEVVIGLEVHAQISSNSKLFSGSSTEFGADPNANVTLLDAGLPGTLPVINEFCIDQAIKTGFGINGTIHNISIFDRKNYFYPDLPLGYQISQFHHPIITDGFLDIEADGEKKRIKITRLHMEQDAGKSIHDISPDFTYIDLNRAGIALMEIVSEPDIRSSAQAMAYVKKLRSILRYLGTCDGNMEQGSLRVDANISLHRPNTEFGTRAEIKNVNSIKFLGQAIEYEIQRQLELLEDNQEIVQETRLFDPSQGVTRSMRSKEDAMDYRYFPDPDLMPLILSDERIAKIKSSVNELPDQKQARYIKDFGLNEYDSGVLVQEQDVALVFESILSFSKYPNDAKILANWIIGDVFAQLNKEGKNITQLPFDHQYLAQMVDLIIDGTISGKIAKDLFIKIWNENQSPIEMVKNLGLQQVSDESVLLKTIDEVIQNNPTQVEQYKAGKTQLFGFLVGQAMKALKGKGNPQKLSDLLKEKLG